MYFDQHHLQPSSWRVSTTMFLAGAAIGAVAALMMAPASGRDSRAYLRRQGQKVASDVSGRADRITVALKRGRDRARTAVRETMDATTRARAAYDAARSGRVNAGGEDASSASERTL